MIFFFSTRWYKLPSCRVTLFFQVKLNSPNGLRSPFEIKWILLSHSPIRVFRISPRIEAKTSKMTNNHRIVSNRDVSCLQNFPPIKKNFSPSRMCFSRKRYTKHVRFNDSTSIQLAQNAHETLLEDVWPPETRVFDHSVREKRERRKRNASNFISTSKRHERVACRVVSRAKNTLIDRFYLSLAPW